MTWQVRWQRPARKDLSRLDPKDQERVIASVERLAETTHGDVVRLKNVKPPEW